MGGRRPKAKWQSIKYFGKTKYARKGWTAGELAFAFEPDTYTSSGNVWRIRCPSDEHGKPLRDRDIGNCVVGDGVDRVWAKCFSGDCTLKSILDALFDHKEWFEVFIKDLKFNLFTQQEGKCSGCNRYFDEDQLQVDHIVPRSKGGKSHPYNYTLLCKNCNSTKSNVMSLSQLRKEKWNQ